METRGLRKTQADVEFVLDCLAEMYQDTGEPQLAGLIHRLPHTLDAANLENIPKNKQVQVLSIYFQLLNLIEENAAAQFRRATENEAGLDDADMAATLSQIRVMPVLTAHPTEAKRVSILELHREFYLLLVQRENVHWSRTEKNALRSRCKALLELAN